MPTSVFTFELNDLTGGAFVKFNQNLNKTFRQEDRLDKKTTSLKESFSGLGGVLSGLAIGASIKKFVQLGSELEQTRMSFKTMLGSAELANKTLDDLNDFSNITPFTNDEVLKSGRNLIAFGVKVGDELTQSLKSIGDVSAGLKIPFNELSEIYGKIKVQNTVYAEDLNQLAGRGVPVFTELAKVMGVNQGQIKKLASQSKIQFKDIEKAFLSMTGKGGQFHDMMSELSKTVGGKWSTAVGKFNLMLSKLSERFAPIFSSMLDVVIPVIDSIAEFTENYQGLSMTIAGGVGLLGLVSVFSTLNTMIPITTGLTKGLSLAFKGLKFALGPIGLALMGIGYTVKRIHEDWDNLKNAFSSKGILAGLKRIGLLLVDTIYAPIQSALELLAKIPGFFGKAFGRTLQDVKQLRRQLNIVDIDKRDEEISEKKTAIAKNALLSASLNPSTSPQTHPAIQKGVESLGVSSSKETNIIFKEVNLAEGLQIVTGTLQEGTEEMKEKLTRTLLEVLNSANQIVHG